MLAVPLQKRANALSGATLGLLLKTLSGKRAGGLNESADAVMLGCKGYRRLKQSIGIAEILELKP